MKGITLRNGIETGGSKGCKTRLEVFNTSQNIFCSARDDSALSSFYGF